MIIFGFIYIYEGACLAWRLFPVVGVAEITIDHNHHQHPDPDPNQHLSLRDVIARHSGLTLTYGSSGSGWRELGPPQVIVIKIIVVITIVIISSQSASLSSS